MFASVTCFKRLSLVKNSSQPQSMLAASWSAEADGGFGYLIGDEAFEEFHPLEIAVVAFYLF